MTTSSCTACRPSLACSILTTRVGIRRLASEDSHPPLGHCPRSPSHRPRNHQLKSIVFALCGPLGPAKPLLVGMHVVWAFGTPLGPHRVSSGLRGAVFTPWLRGWLSGWLIGWLRGALGLRGRWVAVVYVFPSLPRHPPPTPRP